VKIFSIYPVYMWPTVCEYKIAKKHSYKNICMGTSWFLTDVYLVRSFERYIHSEKEKVKCR